MARPTKRTVDYFPHIISQSQALFLLEKSWGNDGYVFYHKLQERLGATNNHYIKLENDEDELYFIANTSTDKDLAFKMLDTLAKINWIDKELWENNKIIWSDEFLENIKDAYKKRKAEVPTKPSFRRNDTTINEVSVGIKPVSVVNNTQTKVKEIKQNKSNSDEIKSSEFYQMFKDKYPSGFNEKHIIPIWNEIDKIEYQNIIEGVELSIILWEKDENKYVCSAEKFLSERRWKNARLIPIKQQKEAEKINRIKQTKKVAEEKLYDSICASDEERQSILNTFIKGENDA